MPFLAALSNSEKQRLNAVVAASRLPVWMTSSRRASQVFRRDFPARLVARRLRLVRSLFLAELVVGIPVNYPSV